jgi:hypothetical protein
LSIGFLKISHCEKERIGIDNLRVVGYNKARKSERRYTEAKLRIYRRDFGRQRSPIKKRGENPCTKFFKNTTYKEDGSYENEIEFMGIS